MTVSPWPAEDHVCTTCRMAYTDLAVPDVVDQLDTSPIAVATADLPDATLRARPDDGSWSVVEYVCHLRDVHEAGTIRLHRIRTEDEPVLEPMLNDLRARRFDYRRRELRPVLDELAAAADGVRAEARRVTDWDRIGARSAGGLVERRSARWMLRQVVHETVHHRRDIEIRREGGG